MPRRGALGMSIYPAPQKMASSNSSVPSAGGGASLSSTAHRMVCDMVTAQVEAEGPGSSGWAEYGSVFLSAEVQDLICARLRGDGPGSPAPAPPDKGGAANVAHDESGSSKDKKKKKRKLDGAPAAPVAAGVSWTICCMDGTTFSAAMPEGAPVAALKREIGVLRELPCFTMELFVKGVEEPLDDAKPLRSVDRAPLFLLLRLASDRLALQALFTSTGGADWKEKEGWMTDAELGDWHGVTVDEEGRVTKLELGINGLAGPLPSDIQQLSALQHLDLCDNALTGPIAAELGQLAALTVLSLGENELSGPVPAELGQLAALRYLWLNANQLSGTIPAELRQLAALKYLFLSDNQLSGPIPAELRQLPALESLFLSGNQQLTGQEALRGYMEEHSPDCKLYL